MSFTVEIPDYLVPDNFFGHTLFECVDIYVNHELVSAKASNSDYYLSELFITRQVLNQPYSNTANVIAGYFSDDTMDADQLTTPYVTVRRRAAVELTRNGQKYYQYMLYVPINHGLGKNVYM